MCPKVQFTVTFLTTHLENHVCMYVCVYMLVVFIPTFFTHALSYLLIRPNNKSLYETKSLSKLLSVP